MFIWTSEQGRVRAIARRTLLGLGMMALAGCLAAPAGKPQAMAAVAFYEGAVVVTGPRGYCVDAASVRRGVSGSFALIASCLSLGQMGGVYADPAVMTISVLPRAASAQAPDAQAMARALAPAEVRVAQEKDGLAVVQVMQGGDAALPGGDPVHWRAGLVINGHLVGLAVYGPEGQGVSGAEGQALVQALARAMRAASPSS